MDVNISQKIIESLEKAEQPTIATTLIKLSMLHDTLVTLHNEVSLNQKLPFSSNPGNDRNYPFSSIANAIHSSRGKSM